MSEIEPRVMRCNDSKRFRAGKGFSLGEIQGAGLTVHEAKRLSLRIDRRRKTTHEINIQAIKAYVKEQKEKLKKEKAEEAKKITFEEAEKQAVTELTKIEGLNKKLAKKLFQNKIDSLEALSSVKAKDIAKKLGVSETRIKLWIEDAKVLTGKVKPEPEPEPEKEEEAIAEEVIEEVMKEELADLTKIKNLTEEDTKKLAEIGILTLEDLAEEDAGEISEIIGIPQDVVKGWIQEAKKLTKPSKKAKKKAKKAEAEKEEKPAEEKKKKVKKKAKKKKEAKKEEKPAKEKKKTAKPKKAKTKKKTEK
ncbi:MAG: ribosomal protein L13e [Candidatus Freyarchaeota archaeon]